MEVVPRRVATLEAPSHSLNRRYATTFQYRNRHGGLKPAATIMASLRDIRFASRPNRRPPFGVLPKIFLLCTVFRALGALDS